MDVFFLKIFIFSPGILYSYKYFKKKGLNFYKISLIHLDSKAFISKNNPSLRVVIIYFHFFVYFSNNKSFNEIKVTAIKIIAIPRKSMG